MNRRAGRSTVIISGLVSLLLTSGCVTTGSIAPPRSPEAAYHAGLVSCREGRWADAVEHMKAASAGGLSLEAAPFLAAELLLRGAPVAKDVAAGVAAAGDSHAAAVNLLTQARKQADGEGGKSLQRLDSMLAHLVGLRSRQALRRGSPEQVTGLLAALPAPGRFNRQRDKFRALAAVGLDGQDARGLLDRVRAKLPYHAELAAADRLTCFREGVPREGLVRWNKIRPAPAAGDLLAARRARLEGAIAGENVADLARSAAALGWLDEALAAAAGMPMASGEGSAIARDIAAIRALACVLLDYHGSAASGSDATVRRSGVSLEKLHKQLLDAAAGAGLELTDRLPLSRSVPLSVELDSIPTLLRDLEPPAQPAEDGLVELLARYGMVIDMAEVFGAVDARLYTVDSIAPTGGEYWGRQVDCLALRVDQTIVPGGVRSRLGVGGISGRAALTGDAFLVVGDVLRPSKARIKRLRALASEATSRASTGGGQSKAADDSLAPLPEWSRERYVDLVGGWFDSSWSDDEAYRHCFELELAHTHLHEFGHAYDLATLIPLGANLGKALHILLEGEFSESRINGRLEEGAENFALAFTTDPYFVASEEYARLSVNLHHPGVILLLAAGGNPWKSSYTQAARTLARRIEELARRRELDADSLRSIGAARAIELAIPWPPGVQHDR